MPTNTLFSSRFAIRFTMSNIFKSWNFYFKIRKFKTRGLQHTIFILSKLAAVYLMNSHFNSYKYSPYTGNINSYTIQSFLNLTNIRNEPYQVGKKCRISILLFNLFSVDGAPRRRWGIFEYSYRILSTIAFTNSKQYFSTKFSFIISFLIDILSIHC